MGISDLPLLLGLFVLWRTNVMTDAYKDAFEVVGAFNLRRYRVRYMFGTYDLLLEKEWKYFFSLRSDLPIKKKFKPIVYAILNDNNASQSIHRYRYKYDDVFRRRYKP